jgi:hypothetical protein
MSETTTPTSPDTRTDATQEPSGSFPLRLWLAVLAAFQADLGCVIGAFFWFALMAGSYFFAAQLTPCTSAGGIPCAH